VAETVPPGSSVILGDTIIVPQYRTTGSGETQEIGELESFASSKTTGDPNYKAPVGTPVQIYSADGQFVDTVKTKKDLSFFGGIKEALKDPVVLAALGAVTAGATGLFSGAGAAEAGLTAADLAIGGGSSAGLTSAQLAASGLSASEIAALT